MRKALALSLVLAACTPGGTSNIAGLLIIEDEPGSSPTCATATAAGDLCVEDAIESNGALDIGGAATIASMTVTGGLTASSTLGVTGLTTTTGGLNVAVTSVTDTASLGAADCGSIVAVTAGIDTKTITLPEASTVLGCCYHITYVGADGGALVDITPLDSDADGIEGSCTLAASVVTFSGTADADIGLTKATGLTGDSITLCATTAAMWTVFGCTGIWANN